MSKFLAQLKMGFMNGMVYRGQTVVWMLASLVWIAVLPFVWLAIYGDRETIDVYNKQMIVGYFVLMPWVESMVASYIYESIHENIRDGSINQFLIKPTSYLLHYFWDETGFRVQRFSMTTLVLLCAYPLLSAYAALPTLAFVGWWIPIFLIAAILNYLVSALVGILAFWTTDGEWIKHIWWAVQTFAMGFLAPISFFPETMQTILRASPFPLMLEAPITMLLGTTTDAALAAMVAKGVMWIVILFSINVLVWRFGTRRVEGIGM